LKVIHSTDGFYDTLEKNAAYLSKGLLDSFDKAGVKVRLNRVGSMMTLFFNGGEDVHDAQSARRADRNLYARFFHGMMNKGIYLAPSQFEAFFLSSAHTREELDFTINSCYEVLVSLKGEPDGFS